MNGSAGYRTRSTCGRLSSSSTLSTARSRSPRRSRTMNSLGTDPASNLAYHAGLARRAFERVAVPFRGNGSGFISALQEIEQRVIRIGARAHSIVGQDELGQSLAEEGSPRPYAHGAKTFGLRIGIRIERGIIDRTAARPEAGAADLMRIGFAGDCVGKMRHAAGMARRAAARKARDREIETAPEEMHRASLAEKAGAELLEHPIDADENPEEAADGVGIV